MEQCQETWSPAYEDHLVQLEHRLVDAEVKADFERECALAAERRLRNMLQTDGMALPGQASTCPSTPVRDFRGPRTPPHTTGKQTADFSHRHGTNRIPPRTFYENPLAYHPSGRDPMDTPSGSSAYGGATAAACVFRQPPSHAPTDSVYLTQMGAPSYPSTPSARHPAERHVPSIQGKGPTSGTSTPSVRTLPYASSQPYTSPGLYPLSACSPHYVRDFTPHSEDLNYDDYVALEQHHHSHGGWHMSIPSCCSSVAGAAACSEGAALAHGVDACQYRMLLAELASAKMVLRQEQAERVKLCEMILEERELREQELAALRQQVQQVQRVAEGAPQSCNAGAPGQRGMPSSGGASLQPSGTGAGPQPPSLSHGQKPFDAETLHGRNPSTEKPYRAESRTDLSAPGQRTFVTSSSYTDSRVPDVLSARMQAALTEEELCGANRGAFLETPSYLGSDIDFQASGPYIDSCSPEVSSVRMQAASIEEELCGADRDAFLENPTYLECDVDFLASGPYIDSCAPDVSSVRTQAASMDEDLCGAIRGAVRENPTFWESESDRNSELSEPSECYYPVEAAADVTAYSPTNEAAATVHAYSPIDGCARLSANMLAYPPGDDCDRLSADMHAYPYTDDFFCLSVPERACAWTAINQTPHNIPCALAQRGDSQEGTSHPCEVTARRSGSSSGCGEAMSKPQSEQVKEPAMASTCNSGQTEGLVEGPSDDTVNEPAMASDCDGGQMEGLVEQPSDDSVNEPAMTSNCDGGHMEGLVERGSDDTSSKPAMASNCDGGHTEGLVERPSDDNVNEPAMASDCDDGNISQMLETAAVGSLTNARDLLVEEDEAENAQLTDEGTLLEAERDSITTAETSLEEEEEGAHEEEEEEKGGDCGSSSLDCDMRSLEDSESKSGAPREAASKLVSESWSRPFNRPTAICHYTPVRSTIFHVIGDQADSMIRIWKSTPREPMRL
eukprot:gene18615-25127_t